MEILQRGSYPEGNIRECTDCHCVFRYYNNEIKIETSTPEEQEIFCGLGITKYVVCPQCYNKNILLSEFYPDPPMFEKIRTHINELKEKFFKKKEGNENGKN